MRKSCTQEENVTFVFCNHCRRTVPGCGVSVFLGGNTRRTCPSLPSKTSAGKSSQEIRQNRTSEPIASPLCKVTTFRRLIAQWQNELVSLTGVMASKAAAIPPFVSQEKLTRKTAKNGLSTEFARERVFIFCHCCSLLLPLLCVPSWFPALLKTHTHTQRMKLEFRNWTRRHIFRTKKNRIQNWHLKGTMWKSRVSRCFVWSGHKGSHSVWKLKMTLWNVSWAKKRKW